MCKVIKNSLTGLYNLEIGNSVYESEVADSFSIDTKEIENVLIDTLPPNVSIELIRPQQNPELQLMRVNGNLIDIIVYEVGDWEKSIWFSHYFFYELMEEIIKASTVKDKIEYDNIYRDGDVFTYTIRFLAPTVGVAVKQAMEIYESLEVRINQLGEQGEKYMRLVANGAFQIDVSHLISRKDISSEV